MEFTEPTERSILDELLLIICLGGFMLILVLMFGGAFD